MNEFLKGGKIYFFAHAGLLIVYYFVYMYYEMNEYENLIIAKNMLIGFTAVNIISYVVSNNLNREKREEKQISNDLFIYGFVFFELIAVGAAFYLYNMPL